MITPDFNLLLWLILAYLGVEGASDIIAGALHAKRPERYGFGTVVVGLLLLSIVLWVMVA